jgi:hypothetical protein
MNMEVKNVLFKPNGLTYLRQKNGWSTRQSPRTDAMYYFACRMFGSPGIAEEN